MKQFLKGLLNFMKDSQQGGEMKEARVTTENRIAGFTRLCSASTKMNILLNKFVEKALIDELSHGE